MRRLYLTFGALLLLLGTTVAAAFIDLGDWNGGVAFTLAGAKAILVAAVFMELRASSVLVRVFCVASLLWLAVLIVGPMHDYVTRTPLRFPLW